MTNKNSSAEKREKKLRIGFSAGEVSGDFQASVLYTFLKKSAESKDIDLEAFGLGGPFMEDAGIKVYHDLTHRSSVGLIESLPYVFDRVKIGKKFMKTIEVGRPDLFIFVDNQGFNIPLSKEIKKKGIKTLYYFPPPISIWGKWNGRKLQKSIDYFLVPFFEDATEYEKVNQDNVIFYGHPFFDKDYQKMKLDEPIPSLHPGFDYKNQSYIYLMPGSRMQELNTLLPVFLKVMDKIYENYKISAILPVSNKNFYEKIKKECQSRPYIHITEKNHYLYMKNSRFSLMASGTATLDALVMNCPMIIAYKISKLTFSLGRLLVRSKWIGMANILAKKEIGKEFLQKQMNSEAIYSYAQQLLEDTEFYYSVKKEMQDITYNLREYYDEKMLEKSAENILQILDIT